MPVYTVYLGFVGCTSKCRLAETADRGQGYGNYNIKKAGDGSARILSGCFKSAVLLFIKIASSIGITYLTNAYHRRLRRRKIG